MSRAATAPTAAPAARRTLSLLRRYRAADPVIARFHSSHAFFRGLMGPLGSTKSTACVQEVFRRALEQRSFGGVRRSRWAIIRNTYGELKKTTLKTWRDWVPELVCPIQWDPPITGNLRWKLDDGSRVEAEFVFIALDKPRDVKKLLSFELTGAWINEARELPKEVVDAVTSRVGRYPAQVDGGPSWVGVIGDTNPPSRRHWWHDAAEHASVEVERGHVALDLGAIRARLRQYLAGEPDVDAVIARTLEGLSEERRTDITEERWDFFRQPGALIRDGEVYLPNPAATWVQYLPGGYRYYYRQLSQKAEEWINVYILGQYGNIFEGLPVYQGAWNNNWHVAGAPLKAFPGLPLRIGWDFGRSPACVVGQLSPRGQLRILREYTAEGMGLRQFVVERVKPGLRNDFPGYRIVSHGDPAGRAQGDIEDLTCLGELANQGIPTEPAHTNDPDIRIQAVHQVLQRVADGQPGLVLDPGCTTLIEGFDGGYCYRRLQVGGEESRYGERPDKNRYSHPHDALQYLVLELEAGGTAGIESPQRRRPTGGRGRKPVV